MSKATRSGTESRIGWDASLPCNSLDDQPNYGATADRVEGLDSASVPVEQTQISCRQSVATIDIAAIGYLSSLRNDGHHLTRAIHA